MDISEIKTELHSIWPDVPAADLCVRILDFMMSVPTDQLQMLTFRELTDATGQGNVTPDLITALSILKEMSLLDARALFVDYDETEYELEPSELFEAQVSGILIHPHTGEEVKNYQKRVIPFFTPSDKFRSEVLGEQ